MKIKLAFFLIIALAGFLRFWQLDKNPPSMSWDEVAWGYNAYSLGIDGKDEFGKLLPITYLESFGDFKPPVYAYLSILPVKIFGLNEFGTRFVSAFFGVLTVCLTYFLTKKIFEGMKENELVAIIASFILAISPWHIMLSRAAFEANIATFFIVSGVIFFLYSFNKNKLLLLSVLSFLLSMYTFNSARIVAPLLLLGLVVGNFNKITVFNKKIIFLSLILGFIIFIPLGFFMTTPQAKLRFQEVNIFSDVSVIQRVNQEMVNDNNTLISRAIHNRRIAFAREFLKHYFDNLSPRFLFIKGDGNPKFSIQSVGQMYIWEIPFFIIGAFLLFRRKGKSWWMVPYWMFIGIMPAATARETPHALRIEAALPTFQIISALGLVSFAVLIKDKYKKIILFPVAIMILFYLIYFLHDYFIHYPRIYAREWQYGYREAIEYIEKTSNDYEDVYLTDAIGRPYIYTLFYLKYDPSMFIKEAVIKREVFGFVHIDQFSKYRFVNKDIKTNKKTLYIDTVGNIPSGAKILKDFYLPNSEKVLSAYTL